MTGPDDRLTQGLALHRQGRLEAAAALYRAVLAEQPENFEALHLLGTAALQTRQTGQGVALLRKAIAVAPGAAPAHVTLGNGLRDLGQAAQALECFDTALALDPGDARAWYNRGNTLMDLRRVTEAAACYEKAETLSPNNADAANGLGNSLSTLNRHQEAIEAFDRAIASRPDFAAAWYNRGNSFLELKQYQHALDSHTRAATLQPELAQAHDGRGNALWELKRPAEALNCYNRAIALDPDFADAYANRANALRDLDRPEEALASCDRAIALRPEHASSHHNRGNALMDLKRPAEALDCYDKAVALRRDYARAWFNRGNALVALGRPGGAADSFQGAIAAGADNVDSRNNRGNALLETNRGEEALANFDTAIEMQPGYAPAWCNRGNALMAMMRLDDAAASFREALALDPDYIDAHWNQSLLLLLTGDLAAGWRGYEWRKKLKEPVGAGAFDKPLWTGQAIAGKTLFLWWEQGLGDTIQFCRYAAMAAHRGARVVMEVQPPLTGLLRRFDPAIETIVPGTPRPDFDFHCPLMSLPLAFGTTLETIPAPARYLTADRDRVAYWASRLGPPGRKPRVGIVWSGSAAHLNDHNRSLPLAVCAPLFAVDAEWICLQQDIRATDRAGLEQSGGPMFLGQDLKDFDDTAALIECLDLVVTVDTSVAHLAGALGKPVWILAAFSPDWRWLQARDDSPWYPSAKLFRQTQAGDWALAIAAVKAALRARLPANPAVRDVTLQRALAAHQRGALPDAIGLYRAVLDDWPDHFDALHLLGVALLQARETAEGAVWIEKALRINPGAAAAHASLGNGLRDLNRLAESLAHFDTAVALAPDSAGAHYNRGNTLYDLRRLDEALASYDRAIAINPPNPEAFSARGNALWDLGRHEEAFAGFEKAIELRPDFAAAHWNKSLCLLKIGRFAEGWPLYEARHGTGQQTVQRAIAQPRWNGEDIAGKTVFVHWEQGFGDTIQFCRYARLLAGRGARVVLEVQPPLRGLIRGSLPEIETIAAGETPPPFDLHVPLLSLPLAMGTTMATIPASPGYLRADAGLSRQWAERLRPSTRRRIGIVWRGNTAHGHNYIRSMGLADCLPLFRADADFFCLQNDMTEEDRALLARSNGPVYFGAELRDFADTAALIAAMDLVVSIDTSVAHLAGAMGKPVWILLPHTADWRWLLDRDDSPWYPTARLFRQAQPRDWAGVVARVAAALEAAPGAV